MHERSKRLAFLKSEAAFILIKYLQDGELQYDENGDYVVADHYNVHHPDIPSFVTEEQRQFFLSLTPDDITQIYINHTESTMF